jgi:hypothetical protein
VRCLSCKFPYDSIQSILPLLQDLPPYIIILCRLFISTKFASSSFFSQVHSSVICHTTGPQPLPKRFFHLMRSRASSFKLEYPLLSPTSSSNCLCLLPRLLVTSIRPFIFPSITSFRRQFLRKYLIYVYYFTYIVI